MRLFSILLFFLTFNAVAGFASQQKTDVKKTELSIKSLSFAAKKITTVNNQNSENDQLQKDFISSASAFKIHSSTFILFLLAAFAVLNHKTKNRKVFLNKLDFHYQRLFKILYPKHVFW
ncbi:hypothetical protein [Pedobacter sp.]|uniref:hypothetical protein n=1 Tax=Pedobacter sp. TaxID=1411316 RepID=UPI003BAC7A25